MAILIKAGLRLTADAASWFSSLTPEQQKEYLELHPNSKYSGDAKAEETKHTEHKEQEETDDPAEQKSPIQQPKSILKKVHEFVNSEAGKPHSEVRRSFGQFIKDKSKGIVKHLVDEVKEAGVAGHAVTKLFRGKKLTDKDKHALKATAIRLVIVVGSMTAGGAMAAALGEGAKHVAKEIAHDFLAHGLINATEKTLMHSSLLTASPEEGLSKMTDMMADYMATSPNVQKILASALDK